MKVFYGLTRFKKSKIKPVVAMGVFDGLHRGHQKIIKALTKAAQRRKAPSLVVTFSPHPQKESSLYSLSHRLKLLQEAGVDLCLVIAFSSAFRRINAEQFLEEILLKRINPAMVLVGRNFTFGRHARGNWKMLRDYSRKAKFQLRAQGVLSRNGVPISSSHIRELIRKGQFSLAEQLLGRPVSIFGRVTAGRAQGRALGYPTANINPDHETLPPFGVYTVRVRMGQRVFGGACYIGNRPTFAQINKAKRRKEHLSVEVHIFDFDDNLYGRRIQIEFVKRLRAGKKFSSVQALTRQMKIDILNCHKTLRL
ncbi:riboflavin biosynthesis protein RibF [Candidatus Omnitrophota bacterium]